MHETVASAGTGRTPMAGSGQAFQVSVAAHGAEADVFLAPFGLAASAKKQGKEEMKSHRGETKNQPDTDPEFHEGSLRERLLEAAGRIFAQRGPQATVREICKEVGCSVAAINYYFGDKHQLYLRCVAAACEHKTKLVPLPELSKDVSPEERLHAFILTLCRRVHARSAVSWHSTLMLREVLSPSKGVAELLQEPFRRDYQQLVDIIAELLGPEHDTEALRIELSTEIVARCMFLRTGIGLRAIVGIDVPQNEDPQLYAEAIYRSVLGQIKTLKAQESASNHVHFPRLPCANRIVDGKETE